MISFSSAATHIQDSEAEKGEAGTAPSAAGMLIADLVEAHPTSVRLRNAIRRGHAEGRIPCMTVGDYVAAGSSALPMFRNSLWSFGRRTALELDGLINSVIREHPEVAALQRTHDHQETRPLDPRRNALVEKLRFLKFSDLRENPDISSRLNNILGFPEIASTSVIDYLERDSAARQTLLRFPNFGRTSLHELNQLCRHSVVRTLSRRSSHDGELLESCKLVLDDISETELTGLIKQVQVAQPPDTDDLSALLKWARSSIKFREYDVLVRRYGLESGIRETLEEIGTDVGVTRERIRQLEAKGIKTLRTKLPCDRIRAAVSREAAELWDGSPNGFLADQDAEKIRRELPGKTCLALDLLELRFHDWLAETATRMRFGYLARDRDADQIRSIAERAKSAALRRPMPIAMQGLLPGEQCSDLTAAIRLETEFSLLEGYIIPGRKGRRIRRALRAHTMLASRGTTSSLRDLSEEYVARWLDDPCGARDLEIVMEAAPHLFLEIEEGIWAAIGPAPSPVSEQVSIAEQVDEPPDVDATTIAGAIQEAIRERGPTSGAALFRDAALFLPAGRSPLSISPVLLTRPDLFERVLPGIYALPEQVPSKAELLKAPLPYLLNEQQARIFTLARRAGESWGTFALWLPETEYRLCHWARFEAPEPLFRSLLSVAQPQLWPVEDRIQADWCKLAEQQGRFELSLRPKKLSEEALPPLDRLLAACLIATERSSLNWLLVNRIMGRRVDGLRARGLLALMVAIEAVELPANDSDDHWQLSHPVTANAQMLGQQLADELSQSGDLSWHSTIGNTIIERVNAAGDRKLGWASHRDLIQLVSGKAASMAADEVTRDGEEEEEEDEDEDDVFARLMREHRRGVEQEQRRNLAQWLVDE